MTPQSKTLVARNILVMIAVAAALILLQGCGGNDNGHNDDAEHDGTNEVADHDPSDTDAMHDEDEADEHGETDDHAEGGQTHGGEVEFTEPHTYAEAIHVIHEQLEKIDSLIESRTLDGVHAEAAVIRDVANSLAQLALLEDSGIPRDAIREINLTARRLAATFDPIDEAGDSGDLAGTQKVYDKMIDLFETLEKYADHVEDEGHDDDDHG